MLNENPSSQSAGCTGSGRSSRTELAGRVCRLIDPEFLKTRTLQRSLETFKRNGCAEIWLAEQADKIVGFCRIGREENNGELLGEIVALYLLPQFQRQGIGKQLMQAGIDQLRIYGRACGKDVRHGYAADCCAVPADLRILMQGF